MQRKSIWLKQSGTTSSSSNVLDPSVHLGVDHEEGLDIQSNDAASLTTSHIFGVLFARDPYSSKLIA